MAAQYQVVAECAHVTVSTPSGRMLVLQLKGALVPADAPELERLLDLGYIAKVGGDETGGVDASGIPAGAYDVAVPASVTSTPVERSAQQKQADAEAAKMAKASDDKAEADAELADKRAAAKAKLPADGSAPHANAGQAVWVEYLVAKGGRYEDLAKAEKDELKALAEQQQS